MSKICEKNKILNPVTNRCVLINGKIGKNILLLIEQKTKEKPKQETKEKPKRETKEKPKKETKEKPKRETKEKPKKETKEKPKQETKEKPKKETKEKPKKETKEKLKQETKEKLKRETKEKPKQETKEKPKRETKEKPKQETKEKPKRETKEKPKFTLNIKTPINHSLNKKQIEKYINACDEETRPILRKIFNNTIHISFETFIRNLNKNIKDLVDYVGDNKIIYFYIDEKYKNKSNYWVYIYIKDYFNFKYPNYKLVLIKDFVNVKSNDYIVFVDDCIYSGNQMSDNINKLNKIKSDISNLKIFLLCSFISSIGLKKIKQSFNKFIKKKFFLQINKYIWDIPLINNYLNAYEIKIIDRYKPVYINSIEGKYLIYFDHKLADTISTITNIYSGYVLNKHNSKIFLSMIGNETLDSKYYEKLNIIPIIKNCENIRNYQLFKPLCPYTPYKISFDNLIKNFKIDKQFIKYKSTEEKKIKNKNKIKNNIKKYMSI